MKTHAVTQKFTSMKQNILFYIKLSTYYTRIICINY